MARALSFYYDLMSQPSRALWITFKLSETSFTDCPVALRKGEQLTDEYKHKINRFQKVPCIVDNGFKLSESIAILRYLASKGQISKDLYPSDLKIRARIDEFLEWHHLNIRLGCAGYFKIKVLDTLLTGKEPMPEEVAKSKKYMEEALTLLENIWLTQKFLNEDKFTVADLFAACELEQTRTAGYDCTEKYPNIRQWINNVRLEASPYYEQAHKYLNKLAAIRSKM